jgi:glycine/D-amino acid oxidase-like deaminating enzyme
MPSSTAARPEQTAGTRSFRTIYKPALGQIIASPCSGHGFKHSAAIGEALADQLRNRPPKVDLSPFQLRHIKKFI